MEYKLNTIERKKKREKSNFRVQEGVKRDYIILLQVTMIKIQSSTVRLTAADMTTTIVAFQVKMNKIYSLSSISFL